MQHSRNQQGNETLTEVCGDKVSMGKGEYGSVVGVRNEMWSQDKSYPLICHHWHYDEAFPTSTTISYFRFWVILGEPQ